MILSIPCSKLKNTIKGLEVIRDTLSKQFLKNIYIYLCLRQRLIYIDSFNLYRIVDYKSTNVVTGVRTPSIHLLVLYLVWEWLRFHYCPKAVLLDRFYNLSAGWNNLVLKVDTPSSCSWGRYSAPHPIG